VEAMEKDQALHTFDDVEEEAAPEKTLEERNNIRTF